MIHKFSLGELDNDEILKLQGLLSFSSYIEQDFSSRMSKKYGENIISNLKNINPIESIIVENKLYTEVTEVKQSSNFKIQAPPKNNEHNLDIQELYAAVIGEKNTEYYLAKFKKFDNQPNGSKISWNWSAFLFMYPWVLYRKMYGLFFILWGIYIVFHILIGYNLYLGLFASFLAMIEMVAFGMFANFLYYKKVKQKIIVAKEVTTDEINLLNSLKSKGGVNQWVWGFAILFLLRLLI